MSITSEAVGQHIRQLGIICVAIVSGVAIFGGVVWVLLTGGGYTPSDGIPDYLGLILNLTGLAFLAKAQLLPRFRPPPPPSAPEADRIAWHRLTTILAFALREGAAFLGLVGALLTGRMAGGFAVAGLAILSMIFAWPRPEQVQGS